MSAARRQGRLWLGAVLAVLLVAGCASRAAPTGRSASAGKMGSVVSSLQPTVAPDKAATVAAEELQAGSKRASGKAQRLPEAARGLRVPVLMYHEIGDGPNELYVSEKSFAAQMALLAQQGFHSVTVDQLYAAMMEGAPLPPKPVVITFDDGYASHYSRAFPVLKQHGFTGVFFVYIRAVGTANGMTWDQLREMQAQGMDIESHTVNHLDLAALSANPSRLRQEVEASRSALQAELGTAVEYFCYPAGRYNSKVLAAVKAAGYRAALTTKPGWVTPEQSPFEWHRVRVNRSDTLTSFAAKVGASLLRQSI